MSLTIWKFPLAFLGGVHSIDMPKRSTVLTAQVQHGDVCLWAIVEPNAIKEPRKFYIVGTGHEMPERVGRYIGTVQQMDGMLIWHIFEGE